MKTNQNMVRKMGDFQVIQRTKDSMFNATSLLNQWNNASGMQKNIQDFERLKETKEFISAMFEDETQGGNSLRPDYQPLIRTRAKTLKNGTRIAGEVWMHPYLFIDFAMWINPRFKLQVIKFVYDQLIKNRHLAGDYYRDLCSRLSQFGDIDYGEVGRILNYVVFNIHKSGLRNEATPEQERDLQQLERDACQYIDMGFVKSYDMFKEVMRTEWKKRHGEVPVELQA